MGVGVLEEIEVCHTHQQSREGNAISVYFLYFSRPLIPYCFKSPHLLCLRGQSAWQHIRTHVDLDLDFWCSCVKDALQNCRNITLTEQAKWAPFLKSFFEISEAIPWPRDHILFTFTMPTTQAMLAKFTKEDPHWKIRLIPDWKFMCWLRWISSGRFSQERGVKKKKGNKTGLLFGEKAESVSVAGKQSSCLLVKGCLSELKASVGPLPWTKGEKLYHHLQED